MTKIVGALVGDKRFYELADQPPEFLHGALGTLRSAPLSFENAIGHQTPWIEACLPRPPAPPPARDIGAGLLKGEQRFLTAAPRAAETATRYCARHEPLARRVRPSIHAASDGAFA